MSTHTSNTMRFNITLPADLGRKVKARPNSSAVIAQSLREKFAAEEKKELDAILAQAYADSAEEDKQIAKEWEGTLADGL